MKIKEIFSILATRKGVSIPEISRDTGISLQVLYNIREGKTRRPHGKTVRRLASYFDVTPAQITGDEPVEGKRMTDAEAEGRVKWAKILSRYIEADVDPGMNLGKEGLLNEHIKDGELKVRVGEPEGLNEGAVDAITRFLWYFEFVDAGVDAAEIASKEELLKKYIRGGVLAIPIGGRDEIEEEMADMAWQLLRFFETDAFYERAVEWWKEQGEKERRKILAPGE